MRRRAESLAARIEEGAAGLAAFVEGLSDVGFDAPVAAQFVIEDHALRRSWHRLARIRAALGRTEG
jgi:hypothetical protein